MNKSIMQETAMSNLPRKENWSHFERNANRHNND